MLPVIFQTSARSTRPPSSGRPGTRLRTPTIRLAPASRPTARPKQAVGDDPEGEQGSESHGERGQRPHDRDLELLPGRAGLGVDLGRPTEEVQADRPHAQPVALRHHGVRDLVQEHREVEQHGEGDPGDVLQVPQPGLLLLDPGSQHDGDHQRDEEPGGADENVDTEDGADAQGPGRVRRTGGPFGPAAGSLVLAHGSTLARTDLVGPATYCGAHGGSCGRSPGGARCRRRAQPGHRPAARPHRHPRRRRASARIPLPEQGGRLQDLRADVPLPHDRRPPRAAVAGRDPRRRGAQGPRGPLRPACGRAHSRTGCRDGPGRLGLRARRRARARCHVRRGSRG